MGFADVGDEVSKHIIGSNHSFFNVFLHRFTQMPKYIYLKDCLAFSGNHKRFFDFWEGIREVFKVLAGLPAKLL